MSLVYLAPNLKFSPGGVSIVIQIVLIVKMSKWEKK